MALSPGKLSQLANAAAGAHGNQESLLQLRELEAQGVDPFQAKSQMDFTP